MKNDEIDGQMTSILERRYLLTYLFTPWSRVLFEKLREGTFKYFPWGNF